MQEQLIVTRDGELDQAYYRTIAHTERLQRAKYIGATVSTFLARKALGTALMCYASIYDAMYETDYRAEIDAML